MNELVIVFVVPHYSSAVFPIDKIVFSIVLMHIILYSAIRIE